MKSLVLAFALGAASFSVASATPISGSFSVASFGGSYVAGSQTASTANGLDFGDLFGAGGNGFGTHGTAIVGNGKGSFAALNGTTANIADILLGVLANPYGSNAFVSFGANSPIAARFSDASYTRSPLGTSVTVTGTVLFSDGVVENDSLGHFSLTTSSQNGDASNPQFTFTGNLSTTPTSVTPEPTSLALLGTGLLSVVGIARRRLAL